MTYDEARKELQAVQGAEGERVLSRQEMFTPRCEVCNKTKRRLDLVRDVVGGAHHLVCFNHLHTLAPAALDGSCAVVNIAWYDKQGGGWSGRS